MRAARVEGAASRQVRQRGRAAGHAAAHILIAKLGQRVDQELGIRMQRLAKDLLGGRLFNDLPGIHDANPVSDVGMHAHIVRDQDDRILEILLDRL